MQYIKHLRHDLPNSLMTYLISLNVHGGIDVKMSHLTDIQLAADNSVQSYT